MDLRNLSVDPDGQKTEYQLINPMTKKPLVDEKDNPVTVTIWGPDSHVQKVFNRKLISKRFERSVKDSIDEKDIEEGEKARIDRCVAIVDDWQNIGLDGKELDCTEENKRKIFNLAPWMVEQIQEFALDRVNFMKG